MLPLHHLKSKKKLSELLFIQYPEEFKFLSQLYKTNPDKCYIGFTKDGRELFKLKPKTKKIHQRLHSLLSRDIPPNYIKSGRKGYSYLSNAFEHRNGKYFFLIDIKKLYPSITADKIKKTLILEYNQSSNVAEFLANLTTIHQKKANGKRALIMGSPLSQSFSFFINKQMFDKLYELTIKHHIYMSVYVDDISFSSRSPIPFAFIKSVHSIIKSHEYEISKGSYKYYRGKAGLKTEITGVKITKYGLFITEKRKQKIKDRVNALRQSFDQKTFESIMAAIHQANLVNAGYSKYGYLLQKNFKEKLDTATHSFTSGSW